MSSLPASYRTSPCKDAMKGKVCKFFKCTYAHNHSELRLMMCKFGKKCGKRLCTMAHPDETREKYMSRAGLPWPLDVVFPPLPDNAPKRRAEEVLEENQRKKARYDQHIVEENKMLDDMLASIVEYDQQYNANEEKEAELHGLSYEEYVNWTRASKARDTEEYTRRMHAIPLNVHVGSGAFDSFLDETDRLCAQFEWMAMMDLPDYWPVPEEMEME